MRVAIVTGTFPQASEFFVLQHVRSLLDADIDVEVFAWPAAASAVTHRLYRGEVARRHFHRAPATMSRRSSARFFADKLIHAGGLRVARHFLRQLRVQRRLVVRPTLQLAQLLSRPPFDIVHAHFGDWGKLCATLPRSTHLVTTFHGYDVNVAPRQQGRDIYRRLFRRGQAFTVNSQFLLERVVALGCPRDRLHHIPMGVDTRSIPFRFTPRQSGQPLRLLTVARLVPVKGLESAIRAVAALHRRGVNLRYRIIGAGPLYQQLADLVEQLQLGGIVQLHGGKPHAQVRAAYRCAHLFLLPSVATARGDEEAQGVVVQEAQASGLPVVVSDSGGIREGMLPGGSGVVFRAGDPTALAAAIQRLLNRDDEWPAMAAAGRKLVEERFDTRLLARRTIKLYRTLVTPCR